MNARLTYCLVSKPLFYNKLQCAKQVKISNINIFYNLYNYCVESAIY